MKLLGTLILLLGLWWVSVGDARASGFHLKSIGNVETGGRQISHWWYSGSDVVFHGEALPGAAVTIDVDGTSLQINADSAGNWDFRPQSALTSGDHQVILTSDGSTVKFTLTTGVENVNWDAVGSGQAETMPTVGTSWPTILLSLIGLLSIGWGGKMIANVGKE